MAIKQAHPTVEEAARALAAAKGYEIRLDPIVAGNRKQREQISAIRPDGVRAASAMTWQYMYAWVRRASPA